ncbi:MAG: phosphatase PAP2 family protein, partial [Candidatus Zixiibacteriota bacterium]
MSIKALKLKNILQLSAVTLGSFLPQTALAKDYLSAGEVAAVSASAVGIMVIGHNVKTSAHDNTSLIHGPVLFDEKLQRFLGGSCREGKTNFLDNTFGSAFTPLLFGTLLVTADLNWPATDDKGKMAAQDLFLYGSGLLATKGITSLTKGLVARERPLPCLEPSIAGLRENIDFAYDRNSFFSGHASGAFFAATYVNKRLRSLMRHELSSDEFD